MVVLSIYSRVCAENGVAGPELEGHRGSWLKQPKVRVFPRVPSRRMKNEVESRGKSRKALSKAGTGSNALEGQVSAGEKEEPGALSVNPLRLPLRHV